jgi:hypothetical protein
MTKKEIREEIVFAVEQKLVPTMAYFMEKYHSNLSKVFIPTLMMKQKSQ